MQSLPKKIAVIGGGISGLSAAWYLIRQDQLCRPTIFEASDRAGGTLQTICRDGFLIEKSADMFTTDEPDALDFCRELGIEDRLVNTCDKYRRALICLHGKLTPVPAGFAMMSPRNLTSIWNTPLLDVAGKMRMLGERYVPVGDSLHDRANDESLQDFAIRRFGLQAFQRLIQPLIGGIYTADPALLSMKATMRRFLEQEQQHGSLIAAARSSDGTLPQTSEGSGARYGKFVAPQGGMQEIVDACVQRLPEETIRLNRPVEKLLRNADGSWTICSAAGQENFDAVIVATAAHRAATLLESVDLELSQSIRQIPFASSAVVIHGVRRKSIGHPLDGFGFVVPQIENRKILACSFSSVKFAGRAPDDCALIRTFVGGALQPELLELNDAEITQLVEQELREIVSLNSDPLFSQVVRWENAMPQYHLGHVERVAAIERQVAEIQNLAIAGNAYRGVGIPACIRSGKEAAMSLLMTSECHSDMKRNSSETLL